MEGGKKGLQEDRVGEFNQNGFVTADTDNFELMPALFMKAENVKGSLAERRTLVVREEDKM